MKITSDAEFSQVRQQLKHWRKRHSMFKHDIVRIENAIEQHIQNYSIAMVHYRQTKSKKYLEKAQFEIDEINRVIGVVEKIDLMAMLSKNY